MKIGLWINENYNPNRGGGFSYADRLIKAMDTYNFTGDFDLCFISLADEPPTNIQHEYHYVGLIPSVFKKIPFLGNFIQEFDKRVLFRYFGYTRLNRHLIDFVYYLTPGPIPSVKSSFVVCHWDIGHCSTYPFPEIESGFNGRYKYYNIRILQAMLVFAESEAGKRELLKYTPLGEHKIRVVPIFGGGLVDLKIDENSSKRILKKWCIHEKGYFLYPAQYWAHKNHVGLLNGFSRYVKKYSDVKLVLCGSDKGNKKYVYDMIHRLGLDNNVLLCGFVSDEELAVLYRNALALVMASYFGPTNMPPIEALDFGTPVVCSDIEGHREILGESGVFFDPKDYNSIADGLIEITEGRDKYARLIKERKTISKFNIAQALKCIDVYLKEACVIRSTWKYHL